MRVAFFIGLLGIGCIGFNAMRINAAMHPKNALVAGRTQSEPTKAFPSIVELNAYRRHGWAQDGIEVNGTVTVHEFHGPAARIDQGWMDARYLARNAHADEIGVR
jgi:hypothetical protein